MAETNIIWTSTAARQRREILKYWTTHNHSDEYARKLIQITKHRVKIIAKYPESGVETAIPDTRMVAMGHFSIYYKMRTRRF